MLLLVAGCPATGKTTFVHENWPNDTVIEFDEWVTAYYGLPFVAAMDKYVAEFPESQHKYFNEIGKLYTQKKRLIVCDTFTYRKDRLDFLRYMDEKFNIPPNEIKIDYLVAKYKTIKERNARRKDSLPENIMLTMFYNQEFPMAIEGFWDVEIISNEYQ